MFDWLFGNSRAEDRVDRILDGLRQPMWRWTQKEPRIPTGMMWLKNATVYDYNRHGVVAFKVDDLDTKALKELADRRAKVSILVYIVEDAP